MSLVKRMGSLSRDKEEEEVEEEVEEASEEDSSVDNDGLVVRELVEAGEAEVGERGGDWERPRAGFNRYCTDKGVVIEGASERALERFV